jgi:hypothetical protein
MARGFRRCAVLVLVLAFAASGLAQALGGSHAALAASHAHVSASLGLGASGESCCTDHDDQFHGAVCFTAGACAFCVPVASFAALAPPDSDRVEIERQAVQFGRILDLLLRPPKPFSNV